MTKTLVLVAVVALALAAGRASAQTAWGGDDEGFIPPNRATASCENALEKAIGKAVVCVAKCHQARATGKLADEAAEDDCESNVNNLQSCKAKFNKTRDKLINSGNCPACLDQVAMDQMFALSETFIDMSTNGQVYCGQ